MNSLAFALFSTLMVLSNAGYWDAGPCPPKPEVITPFEVERVSKPTLFRNHIFLY